MSEVQKSLLIVDDDTVYRQRLAMAMEKRGFAVRQAESVATGIAAAKHPVLMAHAMREAVSAGRKAYLAGRMAARAYATASSPLSGLIE